MKKDILYIMCHPTGVIKTFRIRTLESDLNLMDYEPSLLTRQHKARFNELIKRGYSLSNWHVVEGQGER